MIPKKGAVYVFFDDGKITPSRIDLVEITKVVKYEKADDNLIKEWEKKIKETKYLFKEKTDYFVFGELLATTEHIELIFVRTKDNKWFSFNKYLYDGVLDIDGSLYNTYLERLNSWNNE